MEFVIVTGLSGAGKTVAMRALEDINFYCVDNIPPQLVSAFYDLCQKSIDSYSKKIAIVTDIRGANVFEGILESLEILKRECKKYKILFLDTKDEILIRRFKESRRKHPLSGKEFRGSITKAIQIEREILTPVHESANYIIDTSFLSVSQLKQRICDLFLSSSDSSLMVSCLSFGFKFGMPIEADLVFDTRCLPNPYYIEELRDFTGLDECVSKYVLKWEQTQGFIKKILSFLDYSLPLYQKEGKSQLVIAIGCTGGKHRSVTLAQFIYNYISQKETQAIIQHRDINKNSGERICRFPRM
jgi:UPF0042 nucleotide-binding protein